MKINPLIKRSCCHCHYNHLLSTVLLIHFYTQKRVVGFLLCVFVCVCFKHHKHQALQNPSHGICSHSNKVLVVLNIWLKTLHLSVHFMCKEVLAEVPSLPLLNCQGLKGSYVIIQSQGLISDCWAWNSQISYNTLLISSPALPGVEVRHCCHSPLWPCT